MVEDSAHTQQLDRAAKRRFVDNGLLVIEDAVSQRVLERAREAYWASLPAAVDPDDPNTWDETKYEDGLDKRPAPAEREAFENLLGEVYPYARELVGPKLTPKAEYPSERSYHAKHFDVHVEFEHDGIMTPYPNYPGEDEYPDALKPHIDGAPLPAEYPDTYTPFNLVACVYLNDVDPGDGGLTAWPGSHRKVAAYFEGNNDIEFYHESLRGESLDELFSLGADMEITGPAGTAFFVHPALIHSIGANLGDDLRLMCLCRLAREDVTFNDLTPIIDLWGPFDGIPAALTE